MSTELAELWRGRIAAVEASGLSAKAWCEQNGIKANLYYFWKHTLSRRNPTTGSGWLPGFLCDEGTVDAQPGNGSIVVKVAGAEIEVHNGCSPELLRIVLLALGERPC